MKISKHSTIGQNIKYCTLNQHWWLKLPYYYYLIIHKTNINSNFADHLLITGHTYDNIEHNMEILHTLPKSHKLNKTEQFEIYKHHKQNKTHILNDQIHFHTHTHTLRHHTPNQRP